MMNADSEALTGAGIRRHLRSTPIRCRGRLNSRGSDGVWAALALYHNAEHKLLICEHLTWVLSACIGDRDFRFFIADHDG
jgi:hypothetical protein